MHPKLLSIKNYTYALPDAKIAKYPLPERDSSRLLVYQLNRIEEAVYRNIDQYLPENSLLVFNNTRVLEARISFQKTTGASIEVFCLEPHALYPDLTTAMLQKGSVVWLCLVGGASKWKRGQVLEKKIALNDSEIWLQAKFQEKLETSFAVQLSWTPAELSFAEILHICGSIPLPPYLKREAEQADKERYQTMYATTKGSVAAPTAGLHFTRHIFANLQSKNIRTEYVTLHVGAGTFKPVKATTIGGHEMHAELIDVDISIIETLIYDAERFVAVVGTTSLRTVESLYWMGVKVIEHPDITFDELPVLQWDPYEITLQNISPRTALLALLKWMQSRKMVRLIVKTQILIAPGYIIRIPHALITNFHQPQSTLLLLIAAFVGDDWRKIYDYALQNDFRFLSYGDGCLLFRH